MMLPEAVEGIRQLRDVHFTIATRYFGPGVPSFGEDMRGIPNQPGSEILV
ncbi:MAG: hypothetical protein ABJB12_07830 [Pseudomonadota bacterium]